MKPDARWRSPIYWGYGTTEGLCGAYSICVSRDGEGAILPPGLHQRISEGGDELPGLRSEHYHRPGEKLNEVINCALRGGRGVRLDFAGISALTFQFA